MKIIITGVNGYISNAIKEHFINTHCFTGEIQLLDVKSKAWLNEDFTHVDTIIHCAALVHKDSSKYSLDDYIEVNAQLTEKIAKIAKSQGVKYFIFFSTEGVYGTTGSLFKDIVLDLNTELRPIEKYEISKKMAEDRLMKLKDDNFRVAIIRPPFVYGKNCPGNYNRLRKVVLTLRFVPLIKNRKSMIYIENLCEFVFQLWRTRLEGIFLPQDLPIRSTFDMCVYIAEANDSRLIKLSCFNFLIKFISIFSRKLRVSFGNEHYAEMASKMDFEYTLTGFRESILLTEKK